MNKPVIVNDKDYTSFEYTPYMSDWKTQIDKPSDTKYEVGQVVYNIKHNTLGVVLGCICNRTEDLRTDMDGMVGFSDIRPAVIEDFEIEKVSFLSRLKGDFNSKLKEVELDEQH